jgi:hypothetical protein
VSLDQSFLDFFWRAVAGAAAVFAIILVAALGIRRRTALLVYRSKH